MTDDPELTRLARAYIDAVHADDTAVMARLTEETRARRRELSPPDTDDVGDAYRVELYQDGDALFLVQPRRFAYAVVDGGDGEFLAAAVAILNGNARTWRPPPVPVAWADPPRSPWRRIARYDELSGEVTVERDPASGQLLAGSNGRRYLGRAWLTRLDAGAGDGAGDG